MLPVLTFVAFALVGWFPPSSQYPDAKQAICATNMVPVGSTVLLYDDKKRSSAVCKVVGQVANKKGQVFNVSASVRSKLGFKNETTLRVYRAIGQLSPCPFPPTVSHSAIPSACTDKLPTPVIVISIQSVRDAVP